MEFNPNTSICIYESIKNKQEAKAYLDFLEEERYRHTAEKKLAMGVIKAWRKHPTKEPDYDHAYCRLWASAVRRHIEDINGVNTLLEKLREDWGL